MDELKKNYRFSLIKNGFTTMVTVIKIGKFNRGMMFVL